MKPLAREWAAKAEGDFIVATQIMRRRKHRVLDAACFHCQQSAEKYLRRRSRNRTRISFTAGAQPLKLLACRDASVTSTRNAYILRRKTLKARLCEAGTAFPKTHDLVVLLNLALLLEPLWSSLLPAAQSLTDYAVDFRYPGDNATLAEARRALKDCTAIRREVRLRLGLSV